MFIRVDLDIEHLSKTIACAIELELAPGEFVGRVLVPLWLHAARAGGTGVVPNLTDVVLGIITHGACRDGAVECLEKHGWIEQENGVMRVHDWEDHQPFWADIHAKRAAARKRKQRQRAREKPNNPSNHDRQHANDVTPMSRDVTHRSRDVTHRSHDVTHRSHDVTRCHAMSRDVTLLEGEGDRDRELNSGGGNGSLPGAAALDGWIAAAADAGLKREELGKRSREKVLPAFAETGWSAEDSAARVGWALGHDHWWTWVAKGALALVTRCHGDLSEFEDDYRRAHPAEGASDAERR